MGLQRVGQDWATELSWTERLLGSPLAVPSSSWRDSTGHWKLEAPVHRGRGACGEQALHTHFMTRTAAGTTRKVYSRGCGLFLRILTRKQRKQDKFTVKNQMPLRWWDETIQIDRTWALLEVTSEAKKKLGRPLLWIEAICYLFGFQHPRPINRDGCQERKRDKYKL